MAEDEPIAYTALAKGTPLVSSTGHEFGTVEHVLQDSSLDLFDGIAVNTTSGLRFVDANLVGAITTARVETTLTDDQIASLPAPDGDAVLEADPEEYRGNGLSAWFGRMFLREHWTHDKNWDRD